MSSIPVVKQHHSHIPLSTVFFTVHLLVSFLLTGWIRDRNMHLPTHALILADSTLLFALSPSLSVFFLVAILHVCYASSSAEAR